LRVLWGAPSAIHDPVKRGDNARRNSKQDKIVSVNLTRFKDKGDAGCSGCKKGDIYTEERYTIRGLFQVMGKRLGR